jgi:hypothetical protein
MRKLKQAAASWWLSAALFVATGHAHAEGSPPVPLKASDSPFAPVHVRLSSDPEDLRLEVGSLDGQQTVAQCNRYCTLRLIPGHYALRAMTLDTGREFELPLRVERSTTFRIDAGSHGARVAGLVIGTAGPILIVAGVVMIFEDAVRNSGCDDDCPANRGTDYLGALGLTSVLVGALATPIGWTMFAKNGPELHDERDEAALGRRTPLISSFHFGVNPLPRGGWGLGASARF